VANIFLKFIDFYETSLLPNKNLSGTRSNKNQIFIFTRYLSAQSVRSISQSSQYFIIWGNTIMTLTIRYFYKYLGM